MNRQRKNGISFPLATILLAFLLIPAPAFSEDSDLTFVSVLKFSAGIAGGALIHEGAHALVAGVTGTHMSWEAGTYNQPIGFTEHASSKSKGVALYSAGFFSQALSAEIILQSDKIDKNDAFVRGMMTWNLVNPILYSLDYWFFRVSNKSNGQTYQGDLDGIQHYSSQGTANVFAITFSGMALFQGYRFLKTQTWAPDWLRGETHQLTFQPLRSGGFTLGYNYSF
jgi:hypothetical protein